MFRLIIFIFGVILSVWTSLAVYEPVDKFVQSAEDTYLRLRSVEDILANGKDDFLEKFNAKYHEFSRLFGKEVAQQKVEEEIIEEEQIYFLDTIFDYEIARWVSVFVGALTFSIYFNIISFFLFLIKPFLMIVPGGK